MKLARVLLLALAAMILIVGTVYVLDRRPDVAGGIFMVFGGLSFISSGWRLLQAPRLGWRLFGVPVVAFGLFLTGCGLLLIVGSLAWSE